MIENILCSIAATILCKIGGWGFGRGWIWAIQHKYERGEDIGKYVGQLDDFHERVEQFEKLHDINTLQSKKQQGPINITIGGDVYGDVHVGGDITALLPGHKPITINKTQIKSVHTETEDFSDN